MGRHSRPTPAQQARANTIKAAAALGVAGTIAFGLHSSVGSDKTVQARSDINFQPDGTPETDPTGSDRPGGAHRSTDTDRPTGGGLAPTASAKPKLVQDGGDETSRDGASRTREPSHTPSSGAPTTAPTSDPGSTGPSASEPNTTTPSSPGQDPTTDPATPGDGSDDQPSDDPQSGGQQGDDAGKDKDHGLVGGVIDGVGDTVGGVLGGLLGG